MARELKFPVMKNVEFFDLHISPGKQIEISGSDIEGLKWRELQYFLGEKVPEKVYNYQLKLKGKNQIYNGRIKVLIKDKKYSTEEIVDPALSSQLDSLSKKVEMLSRGNGVSVDTLIEVTKQSYLQRIEYLNLELQKGVIEYGRLTVKIEKLETDLINSEDEVDDLKGQTGITQYISIAKEFLQMKAGNVEPLSNLKDSNISDIPGKLLEILGVVDWKEVDQKVQMDIESYLRIFIQKLPLKGG